MSRSESKVQCQSLFNMTTGDVVRHRAADCSGVRERMFSETLMLTHFDQDAACELSVMILRDWLSGEAVSYYGNVSSHIP